MPPSSPVQTVNTLLGHLQSEDFIGAADMIDLRDLEGWRREQLAFLAMAFKSPKPGSVPIVLEAVPTDPEGIRRLLAEHARAPVRGMDGVSCLAELAAIPAEELLANYWRLVAREEEGWAWPRPDVVGEFVEGSDARVVCRHEGAQSRGDGSGTVDVVLKLTGGHWRVRLTEELVTPWLWLLVLPASIPGAA